MVRGLTALLFALALAGGVAAAPALEIVEAVIPDWPKGQALEQKGTIVLRFAATGMLLSDVRVLESDLPPAFGQESSLALEQWLVGVAAQEQCGPVRGKQTFVFDGRAGDPVAIGATFVEKVDAAPQIARMPRVELSANSVRPDQTERESRISRKESEALATAKWRRAEERWRATGRALPPPVDQLGGSNPRPVVRIEPKYPREAVILGQDGDVWSRLTVRADGAVTSVEVTDQLPKGDTTFIAPTRQALKRWRFEPARDPAGKAIEAQVCQLISYRVH